MNENGKKDKYFDLAKKLKKTVEHEGTVYNNCNGYSCYRHQNIATGRGSLSNNKTSGDYQIIVIIKHLYVCVYIYIYIHIYIYI